MNRIIKRIVTAGLMALLLSTCVFSAKAYAYSDIPMYFDFQDTVISINAGETRKMHMRANYDYTYHIGPHTSSGTYLECSFKSGTQDVIFHIGADEQVGNVFFHFYVDDPEVQSTDTHDCVEIYVQNIKKTAENIAAPLAKGKTGSVAKSSAKVAMLYNKDGVGMASFSLKGGNGQMADLGLKGIVDSNGKYFDVTSSSDATPVISESDKKVMIANGYLGVCVNGQYKNWQ